MWIVVCSLGAVAGTPTLKGNKLLDDGAHVMNVRTLSMFGTSTTTVTSKDGAQVAAFSVSPVSPSTILLTADFTALGKSFGGQIPMTTPSELVIGWWTAGVLNAGGGDANGLASWATEHGFTLTDTATDQAATAAYFASHPAPVHAVPPPATSAKPVAPPASAPSSVSVRLTVSCKQNVRVFFGSSPTSGGTHGWESPNSVRSVSMKPGSVACIEDDKDHIQTCWTAPSSSSVSLDVGCAGFTQR